jgi:proteasome lid subunit RPN8/RPN11
VIDIKSKLKAHLKPDDKHERCGFVTKRGRVVEVSNVAANPENAFKIDPSETIKWLDRGIVATWHTHPHGSANLSGEDYSCFLTWDDLQHYVVGQDHVALYTVEDGLVVQA